MARWKRQREAEAARRYDEHPVADDTAQTFSDFIQEERDRIHEALAKNIVGYTGQEQPTPIHQFLERGNQYQVAYCGQDWQTQASASFAMLWSPTTESFRPALDLGVSTYEDDRISKVRYQLGHWGALRAIEYVAAQDDGQAFADFLDIEPFERYADSRTDDSTDPIYGVGYIVGQKELDALIKALGTNTKPKEYNKVYEIPGTVQKSQ